MSWTRLKSVSLARISLNLSTFVAFTYLLLVILSNSNPSLPRRIEYITLKLDVSIIIISSVLKLKTSGLKSINKLRNILSVEYIATLTAVLKISAQILILSLVISVTERLPCNSRCHYHRLD